MSARRHKAAAENPLRFTTRNYKHELRLDPKSPRSILEYTDEVWETLCSNVAANGFTGLTFYSGYHPFEYVLDYRGFEKARMHPARQNARVRKAFNRALAVAHRHGLKTFIQHYITHFTPRLAKSLKIHTRGRLADVDQPEINRYQRWCYREMFRQCPDLDGLYFNFESVSRAYEQIRDTAVREFNRMKRKPIMFLRLWGANDPEGIRMIVRIYRGRVIVGHKIPDTNDTYYLPVADSRVTEWKRTLPDVEFAFLVGPCHNCGTNLCQNLWADYDFVQQMLADAERKGADSISFHTITEFFAPDVKGRSVFDREELVKARFNVLHLDAAIDYFHNRTMTPAQRSHWMAERAGVDAGAGKPLYEAVHASSQLILLAFQQFCNTSAHDGYLNPGRYSPIQEPFFYFPANALNNQASRLLWHPSRGESAWLRKRIDTKVAPDDFLQPIIDYVDPSKPKATRNPKKLVNLLKRNAEKSFAAFRKVKRYASKMLAAQLETLLQENAALGEYVRREILAAVHLYGIYFAKGKAAVVKRLRAGLVELRAAAQAMRVPERTTKRILRALLVNDADPEREIALVSKVLRAVERTTFPMKVFTAYVASRREYNEIRRIVRALRYHDRKTIAYARKQLKRSLALADKALVALKSPRHAKFAKNVKTWREFVARELARTTPPKAVCSTKPGDWQPLFWDHDFRAGEHFVEDFLSFFRAMGPEPESTLSMRAWHTARELVVSLRESGVDVADRKKQWKDYEGTGSDSFVMRVHVDTEGKGKSRQTFIVWPFAESVSAGRQPHAKAKASCEERTGGYEMTVRLPWKLLGRKPRRGETWGLNVTSNPSVLRNRAFTWSPQYDAGPGNPILFGKVTFE